jgi:hypothetical protein
MAPRSIQSRRQLFLAALAIVVVVSWGLRLAWLRGTRPSAITADAAQYYLIALHWKERGLYSIDGKTSTWSRLPGYPLFLRLATHVIDTRPHPAEVAATWRAEAMRANRLLDVICGLFVALIAWRLAGRAAAIVGAAAWALEPWASLDALPPLTDVLAMTLTTGCFAAIALSRSTRARSSLASWPAWRSSSGPTRSSSCRRSEWPSSSNGVATERRAHAHAPRSDRAGRLRRRRRAVVRPQPGPLRRAASPRRRQLDRCAGRGGRSRRGDGVAPHVGLEGGAHRRFRVADPGPLRPERRDSARGRR